MKNYYLFADKGQLEVKQENNKLVVKPYKEDILLRFEPKKLVTQLRELADYIEKYGEVKNGRTKS